MPPLGRRDQPALPALTSRYGKHYNYCDTLDWMKFPLSDSCFCPTAAAPEVYVNDV